MSNQPSEVMILDYVRTGRAKASSRGSLSGVTPTDLVVALQRSLVDRNDLDPRVVEDVIVGSATQVGEQGADLARTATLLAGWGHGVPGGTVNRFCASGIDAVSQVSARIRSGELGVAVAGGVESVSRVPMFSDNGPLWTDEVVIRDVGSVHMGISADLNATIDGFSREELDVYGLETQQKATRAWADGVFDGCVVPVELPDGSSFAADELVRSGTTLDRLASLPSAFADLGASGQDAIALAAHPEVEAIHHVHTVGTSPALADGAALLLLADGDGAEQVGLRPRGRVIASAARATDPVIMLTAGQDAIATALQRAGLTPDDIDVCEFAEAFSALCLRLRRDMGFGPERMNPNGGTIAMGHAFGATGAIMVGQCLEELERRQGRYGVAAVSGAAGLGIAVVVERLS